METACPTQTRNELMAPRVKSKELLSRPPFFLVRLFPTRNSPQKQPPMIVQLQSNRLGLLAVHRAQLYCFVFQGIKSLVRLKLQAVNCSGRRPGSSYFAWRPTTAAGVSRSLSSPQKAVHIQHDTYRAAEPLGEGCAAPFVAAWHWADCSRLPRQEAGVGCSVLKTGASRSCAPHPD